MTEEKTMLCVGGPMAGMRFASQSPLGFKVPVCKKYTFIETKEIFDISYNYYHEQRFITELGSISFWVPIDQKPKETMSLLIEEYERSFRNKD